MAPLPRLILVMQSNGTQQANFWPSGAFTSPILEPLLGDPALAARTTLVRGIEIPFDTADTKANEHDMGFARMFTGAKLLGIAGEPWAGAASVDQLVARRFGADSLTLAVHAAEAEPYPKPGFSHRRSFSYVAPGVHKVPTLNPYDAYARYFGDGDPERAKATLARRKSVLDATARDLSAMSARLGTVERDKLEAHANAIRNLERELGASLDPRCKAPPIPFDYRGAPELLVSSDEAIPALTDAMVELLAATIGCGMVRVGTLQLGYAGAKWKFGWVGNGVDVHDCAHLDTKDEGTSELNTTRLVRANRWYASVIAKLARKLQETPEADGTTALDHTLIVWANEFGRGDHSQKNVPLAFVGGRLSGAAKRGRVVDVGPQPFQRVGCSILRSMGIAADGFGDLPAGGPIAGL
jgi:hypothetical protein